MYRQVPGWAGALAGFCVALIASITGYWWQVAAWLDDFDFLTGWVQAVGSVAAILAGFAVVALQERSRRADDRGKTDRLADWCDELNNRAAFFLAKVPSLLERVKKSKLENRTVKAVIGHQELIMLDEFYSKVNYMDLPDTRLMHEAFLVMRQLRMAIRDIEAAEVNINRNDPDCSDQIEAIEGFARAALESTHRYQSILSELRTR